MECQSHPTSNDYVLKPSDDSESSSSSSSSSISSSSSSFLISSLEVDKKGDLNRRRPEKVEEKLAKSTFRRRMSSDFPPESLDDLILSPEKLLDKLLIICPNSNSCQEVFPRSDLAFHLQHRCRGSSIIWSNYKNCERNFSLGRMFLPPLPLAVAEGQLTSIQIYRRNEALGISIVGGLDTPLLNIIIQEIHKDGAIDRDGRLQAGDHLLEVNGIDLTLVNHLESVRFLSRPSIVCQLVVYRQPYDHCLSYHPKTEISHVRLSKLPGEQLGIKLVQKKFFPGIYILDIIKESIAYWDGRLRPDDRILRINNIETVNGTQEQAVDIIQRSVDSVEFLISRTVANCESDEVYTSNGVVRDLPDNGDDPDSIPSACISLSMPPQNHEKIVNIVKKAEGGFGVSVAGGRGRGSYDTPVYITSLSTDAWIYASEQIMRGDILISINDFSLLHLTQVEARELIKCCSDGVSQVQLQIVSGTETSDGPGNFRPSWKFWLSIPPCCYPVKTIKLKRSPLGSLGFSIVGGYSSHNGTVPIFVKSVVRHGPAGRDGRLKSGDLILAVNEILLECLSHGDVVRLLTSQPSNEPITLTIVSWPGSSI